MKALLLLHAMFCLTVVAACGLSRGTYEPLRSYVLEIEEEGEALEIDKSRPLNLPTLLVSLPQPAPGFESQRMAYVQVPHELNYFATSQWVESPARMLAPLLVQRLEHSRMWSSVIPMPTSIRGDYRLDLSNVVLVQEFLQNPSRMRLAWRGQLVNIKDRQVIGTRNFESEEEALSDDAYGGVLAAQQAVSRLLNDLMNWLIGCLQEGSSAHC